MKSFLDKSFFIMRSSFQPPAPGDAKGGTPSSRRLFFAEERGGECLQLLIALQGLNHRLAVDFVRGHETLLRGVGLAGAELDFRKIQP